MATIIPRVCKSGEKRWQAKVRLRRDGQGYSESKTFSTKKAAEKWAKARNDVWVHLPDRAMALIDTMSQMDERIFPFAEKSIAKQ